MNKNSYPVYSKQEQTLAFSVSMGLTFGELCILALRHPMMDFSQFLLRRNHLSPFMIYFLWFGAAFLINTFLGGAFAGFVLSTIKNGDPFESCDDDAYESLSKWWSTLLKNIKIYKWYMEYMPILFLIDPALTTIIFFNYK